MRRLFVEICLLVLALGGVLRAQDQVALNAILLPEFLGGSENQAVGFNFSGTIGEKFIIRWDGGDDEEVDTVLVKNADEIGVSHVVKGFPISTQFSIQILAMNPTGHILSLSIDSVYPYCAIAVVCPEMTTFRVSHNKLEALYIYRPSALRILDCSYNNLSSLDFKSWGGMDPKMESLTHLDCSHNDIVNLPYLNDCKALVSLHCEDNRITDLRARAIPTLREVYCQNNQISVFELDSNPVLERLDCSNNDLPFSPSSVGCPNLAYLDISDNEHLESFSIYDNQRLESIDLSRNPSLRYVYIENSNIKSLDFSANPKLESLNLHGLPALQYLSCRNTLLPELSFSAYDSLPSLQTVECSGNTQLKRLSLVEQSALKTVKCLNNPLLESLTLHDCPSLDSLDFSDNIQLKNIVINNAKLGSLDLSVAPNLESLSCSGNDSLTTLYIDCPKLESLDLHDLPALQYLSCRNTLLPELSFSAYDSLPSLQTLQCLGNRRLKRLDFPDNCRLEELICTYNDSLEEFELPKRGSLKAVDCSNNAQLKTLSLVGQPALKTVKCTDNHLFGGLYLIDCPLLDSLDFSNNAQLGCLTINNTMLRSLDLSVAPNLENVYCTGNDSLTMLKVNNPVLKNLQCDHNRLEFLSIETILANLTCNHNRLTSLCLPSDVILESLTCDSNSLTLSNVADLVKRVDLSAGTSPQLLTALCQVGQVLDFRSEMSINGEATQWNILDAGGNFIPDDSDWGEYHNGDFSFKKAGEYRIALTHDALPNYNGDLVSTTVFYDVTVVDSVARPVFSEPSGAVRRHTSVSLSTKTPDARVYYTTDGSVPDGTASLYTEPIYVNEAVTIKAIAIQDTFASRVAIASYTIMKDTITDTTTIDNECNVFAAQVSIYAKDKVIYVPESIGEMEVFTTNGQCVYRGAAMAIPVKRSGLYVVVAKDGRWKVAVR